MYKEKRVKQSELLQLLLLDALYAQKDSDKIIYQGGTALRWVYNGHRFSEDLDFVTPLPPPAIGNVLQKTTSMPGKVVRLNSAWAERLHDTVEDTGVTLDDIRQDFGSDVAKLGDGVTKLTHLPRVSRGDQHPEETETGTDRALEVNGKLDPDEEADQLIQRSRRYDLVSEPLRKTFMAMGEDVRVVLIKLADPSS